MDDYVAGIHNNPVTMIFALDTDFSHARCLQAFLKFFCQGANLSGGCAGGDDHIVGDNGLASEVNGFYIFCFISIKRLYDDRFYLFWTVLSAFIGL